MAQASAFLEMGARHVILKLGERGCLVMDQNGHQRLPTYRVEAVDTTGCGDNFVAGVILGILRGEDLAGCGMLGNAMGSMNAMQRRFRKARPMEEVLAFMERAEQGLALRKNRHAKGMAVTTGYALAHQREAFIFSGPRDGRPPLRPSSWL